MKRFLYLILLFILPFAAMAQYVPGDQGQEQDTVQASQNNAGNKKKDNIPPNRYLLGGNFGLQLGTETLIDLSPEMGYFLNKNLLVGGGITYIYYNDSYYHFSTSVYGGRIFGRYYFAEPVFAQVGYEVLNLGDFNSDKRVNVGSVLAGLGANIQIGDNAYFTIAGLWNFNETALSPYTNPIIRMGISFGL